MVQRPSNPHDLPTDFDNQVVLFPPQSPPRSMSRFGPRYPTGLPAPSPGHSGSRPRPRLRRHAIRQVVILDVGCRLGEVVEELDRAIQLALADAPRGVVCDLSDVSAPVDGDQEDAVEVLAMAGRHVRDWPGVSVAVACPDPRVREALRAHALGAYLIVTESLFSAVSAVLATPALLVEQLRLAPHPTAPRASREFVSRTLLDWRLGRIMPVACLVVSDMVASSTVNACTDIDLSVAWNLGALRLTVRDHGPALAAQQPSVLELKGRRLTVVAGLSRVFGVLPTTEGGKVVWAVLEAPRPRDSNSAHRSAIARQESLILNDAHALAVPLPQL